MSRTYRRRNAHVPTWMKQPRQQVFYGPGPYDYVWMRLALDFENEEYLEDLRYFHLDNHPGHYTPPSWWNTLHQRMHRAKARKEITRWMKDPDYEVMIEDKPPRDYWW